MVVSVDIFSFLEPMPNHKFEKKIRLVHRTHVAVLIAGDFKKKITFVTQNQMPGVKASSPLCRVDDRADLVRRGERKR